MRCPLLVLRREHAVQVDLHAVVVLGVEVEVRVRLPVEPATDPDVAGVPERAVQPAGGLVVAERAGAALPL